MTKKLVIFGKKLVTPSVAAPSDTNLSDATAGIPSLEVLSVTVIFERITCKFIKVLFDYIKSRRYHCPLTFRPPSLIVLSLSQNAPKL